jgi:hypothetical protein
MLVDIERGVHKRGVHPCQELWVVGVVWGPPRVAPGTLLRDALDALVPRPDAPRGLLSGPHVAEDDLRGQVDRAGQAPPGILAVLRVVRDAGRHQRMRDLQDQCGSAAGKQHALAVDAPRDGARAK